MMKRIWAAFYARSLEFLRDRSTLGWNILLPVALVFGLAFVFSGDGQPLFKVAVVEGGSDHAFLQTEYVDFHEIAPQEMAATVRKVGRHQVDMLLDLRAGQEDYWVNSESRNGYFLEKLLRGQGATPVALTRQSVEGEEIRYVDWVVPGILGMNLMFSCLFGVGFVIVRYRKSGYLKRLNATPLNATEFLLAQIFSRLLLIVVVISVVFLGTDLFLNFTMEGSHWLLLLVLIMGAFSLIALSLVVAARVSSEELAGGLLNVLTWPMMLLSGVWFSLEGTNALVQWVSQLSPLTHTLTAARAIMLDGAGFADISMELLVLAVMSLVFLVIGAATFKWTAE